MVHIIPKQYRDFPVVGYDQQIPPEIANEIFSQLSRCHLDLVGEAGWIAAGEYIANCITSGDFHLLCDFDPDVTDLGPNDAYHLRQCAAFWRKRADINLGRDLQSEALAKFLAAENRCRETNAIFRAHSQGRLQFHPDVEWMLYSAQQKICAFLRKHFPEGAPEVHELKPRFGPGATTTTPKKNACIPMKLWNTPACAANTTSLLPRMMEQSGLTREGLWTFPVEGSKVSFAPKNATALRPVCTEPAWNGMFQNGLGDALRRPLLSIGINLRDQSANQRGAMYGSIHGKTATVDKSAASDLNSLGLTKWLFPMDWEKLLFELSCRETTLPDGTIIELHKLSSMGNGFTFPIECLVFWALATAAVDFCVAHEGLIRDHYPGVLVYGDDVILPVPALQRYKEVLNAAGFLVNEKKTHSSGSFRESCGKDFISGTDVRPWFCKCDTTTTPSGDVSFVEGRAFFSLHNFYYAKGLFDLARKVEAFIHPSIRLHGPQGYGDGHLHGAYIPINCGRRTGAELYKFSTWLFEPNLLRDEIFTRFAGYNHKKRGVTFKERYASFAMRISTYAIYTRDVLREGDPCVIGLDRECKKDRDIWVTPGRGPLRRTSVYTYEPVRLK